MCDVDNPLVGPQGAAAVYGPQKGATPAQVEALDAGLRHLAERIAADLFKEWEEEIATIENAKFKSKSRASLQDTRNRFARLQRSMARAEASMDPVLTNLQDYVLYLKHNLNAQAVSSLRKEVADIEADVSSLIADMNRSIKEADAFVKTM